MIGKITEEERFDVVRHACPGAGACGGMYTANTMSSALEALGMSLPYSSSTPALNAGRSILGCNSNCANSEHAAKAQECIKAAKYLKHLLEKDIKPR